MRFQSLTPHVAVVELPDRFHSARLRLELRVGWADGVAPTHAAWVVRETGRVVRRVEVGEA